MISRLGLADLVKGMSKEILKEVSLWYTIVKAAQWQCFQDVQTQFNDADLVAGKLVFNIGHNRYRLIVLPVFRSKKLYVKAFLTHKEYDRGEWKTKWTS